MGAEFTTLSPSEHVTFVIKSRNPVRFRPYSGPAGPQTHTCVTVGRVIKCAPAPANTPHRHVGVRWDELLPSQSETFQRVANPLLGKK